MKLFKAFIFIIIAIQVLLFFNSCQFGSDKKNISISGAFALYPLTVKWAEEYQKLHPEVSIDVSAGGAGKGMTDVLSGMVDLAMLSRTVSTEETANKAWSVSVARDAVIPIVNSSNPCIHDILEQGLTRFQFTDIYVKNKIVSWNQLKPSAGNRKIEIYTRSDACGAAEIWAKYLGSNQESLAGTGVFGDPGISDAVMHDKFGIGYSNVIYVFDTKTRKPYTGLTVIPIDINNNGKIDINEDFCKSLDSLMNAISSNKYPSPPARDLYLISKEKPVQKTTLDFLNWILTDGQKYVHEAGFVQISADNITEQKAKLIK